MRPTWCMAEGVGFEPTSPFGETVFKTAAIDHSAIPPGSRLWRDTFNHQPLTFNCPFFSHELFAMSYELFYAMLYALCVFLFCPPRPCKGGELRG
jgi:hypothetical protein